MVLAANAFLCSASHVALSSGKLMFRMRIRVSVQRGMSVHRSVASKVSPFRACEHIRATKGLIFA